MVLLFKVLSKHCSKRLFLVLHCRILNQIFTEEIPFLFISDFHRVKHHQDNEIIHTSKGTTAFFDKMKIDARTECIPFQHISTMSSDVSPMNYRTFGLFKRALSKLKSTTIDGLCRVMEKKRNRVGCPVIDRVQ